MSHCVTVSNVSACTCTLQLQGFIIQKQLCVFFYNYNLCKAQVLIKFLEIFTLIIMSKIITYSTMIWPFYDAMIVASGKDMKSGYNDPSKPNCWKPF